MKTGTLKGSALFMMIALAGCSSAGAEVATPNAPATPEDAGVSIEPPEPAAGPGALFSSSQAERGRAAFQDACAECHTTSEFRGRIFQADWGRRTVYSLYRTIRSTMPDSNPGGLEEAVYLDVVAYILDMNGHDAGSVELSADSPMRDVRIDPATSQD